MAADNKLELVVEVDVNRANASIKSVNAGLSSMEATAVKAARGASSGVDGLNVSVAKGAAAASILASAFERVVGWVKTQIEETSRLAARNETLAVVNAQLARANGYNEGSIDRLVTRIGKLLTFAQWLALSAFCETCNGAQRPFFWYPNVADYDPTGACTAGRYLVRFEGALSRTYRLGRQEASLRLIELQ